MNHFSEMEWNWENLVAFGSKAIETEKKLQFTDWMIADDAEIDAGSFNISAGGGASGSDGGHVSSAKSSISASTDSSTKDGIQTPNFRLMSFEGFSRNFSNKPELEGGEVLKDGSIGSVEPLIGLKLGKRTYFENSNVKGGAASCSVMPTPSTTNLIKKTKSSGQNASPAPRCLVEGCNADLSLAKEYHRKHRVCDVHSKSPNVFIGGVERRFCQQCSRFHSLAEFDEKKRSCRRRLSDHNARRRKPPQETIQFNSARLSTPFYAEGQGFVLNNAAYMFSRNTGNGAAPWNTTCNPKFTITKGYPPKPDVDGSTADGLMHMPGTKLPHFIHMLDTDNSTNGILATSKNSLTNTLNPGSKGLAMISSTNADAAPDYRRALSLLSNNSWGSELSVPIHHPLHENGVSATQQTMPPEGIVPLSPSDLWLTGHQSAHNHPRTLANNGNSFHKTPYEADFYSTIL